MIAYRSAQYFTPLWADANDLPGRFNRAGQDPTQYLCLHPLGPAAEALRNGIGTVADDVSDVRLNLWAVRVPDGEILDVSFDTCTEHGITASELVGDDHSATQDLADRLREGGVEAIKVPSAALPGTDNLVLFGPRVADDYLGEPVEPEELPTGHLTDYAHPPQKLWPYVRWIGTLHSALVAWQSTGVYEHFQDPMPGQP